MRPLLPILATAHSIAITLDSACNSAGLHCSVLHRMPSKALDFSLRFYSCGNLWNYGYGALFWLVAGPTPFTLG